MATPASAPVRTCVLRAGINCCKGCQTKAKRKLQSVCGVIAVEYNAEQGLLIVSGDANPETLLRKLTEWGKKAELLDIPGSVPVTPEHNQAKKNKYCFLLWCFGKPRTKTKVEPYRGAWAENATAPLLYTDHAAMFRPPPPHSPPFIQFPHMVNSRLHYPHLH